MKVTRKEQSHATFLSSEDSWVSSFQALFPILLLSLAIFFFSSPHALATGSVTLGWSPNSESDLAGYKMYLGTTSGIYGSSQDVGMVTNFMVTNLLEGGTYYFTVTAYDLSGNEGAPSLEVSATLPSSPDTEPPIISLTAPGPNALVSGSVQITASATDNVGVVGVQFQLDGNNLGAEVLSSPYSLLWDSTTVDFGAHVLSAIAKDAAGNTTQGPLRSIIVTNPGDSISNISTRSKVGTSDEVMIAGFIIAGTAPKTVLIRVRGPSLGGAPFHIPGTLADPIVELFAGTTMIAQNDNWQSTNSLCLAPAQACGSVTDISATALDPCQPNPGQLSSPAGCDLESALLITLAPGPYTAIVRGGTGVSLIELNETPDDTSPSVLSNISTRAKVGTSDEVMIGGFIISGPNPKTVLIRARGPSLNTPPFNVPDTLPNPSMELFSGSTKIAQNNDWQTTDRLCLAPATDCGDYTEISATGVDPCTPNPGQPSAPAGCSQESALLVTLDPGAYTAIVRGVGGGTGVGLIEVNEPDLAVTVTASSTPKAVATRTGSTDAGTGIRAVPFDSQTGGCGQHCEERSGTSLDSGSPSVSQAIHTIVTGLMPSQSVRLTIEMEGFGSGEITSDVSGITCTTGTCAASFTQGAIVTLTATAEADSEFVRFSGDTDCTDGVVTLDTGTTCHATFRQSAVGTN